MDVEPLPELLQRVETLASITAQLAKMVEARQAETSTNANHATISINAGGLGVWIAITACLVMLAVNAILVVTLIDHGRQIDGLDDKLTATYMMAPHLRPPEKKTK